MSWLLNNVPVPKAQNCQPVHKNHPTRVYSVALLALHPFWSHSQAMRGPSVFAAVVLCAAGLSSAHADIFAFTDAAGGVHYSNVPDDARYARILAEPVTDPASSGILREDWRSRAVIYSPLIDTAAQHAEVSPALLRAVVAVESAFDPRAVSPKGAQGLMQLLPSTAQRYGVRRPFDPADNLRGGARYLGDLLKRYGNDLQLALAAYNAGEEAVERYGRTIPPFRETRAYVPAVLRYYRKFLRESEFAGYLRTLPPAT